MLSRRERIALATLLPSGANADLEYGLFDTQFDEFLPEFEAVADGQLKLAFRIGLFAAVWLAPLMVRRRPPLSVHPEEVRERALVALEHSPFYLLRQSFQVMKLVVCLCYGADPRVRTALHIE
jgi:hypothetical protein